MDREMTAQGRLLEDPLISKTSKRTARPFSSHGLQEVYAYAVQALTSAPGAAENVDVEKEVSRLKHLLRLSVAAGGPDSLSGLVNDPGLASRLFAAHGQVHGTTLSSLWSALQRFARWRFGSEGDVLIVAIENELIPRRVREWHQAPRVPGGNRDTQKRTRRVLEAIDLLAIQRASSENKSGERALRDQAFVALCCWSSLRLEEIIRLCWEDLVWEAEPEGKLFPIWSKCNRSTGELLLPVHRNTYQALAALHALHVHSTDREPTGPIFRISRQPFTQLGNRDCREILYRALAKADLSNASFIDLKAAFADYLRETHSVGQLELTEIFGYSNHEHIRRLLRFHNAWRLQQTAEQRQATRNAGDAR